MTAAAAIACIGEAMIEIAPLGGDTARIGVAGDTYNTAIYLSRLLENIPVSVDYVTAVGDEAMSERIVASLAAENIGTGLIERRPGAMPGLYLISIDEGGERSFSYWRSSSAARSLFQPPCMVAPDALDRFDLVYFSGISLAILPQDSRDRFLGWIDAYRARGGQIAYDSNYRPALWEDAGTARRETMRVWSRCDVALPSVDDEMDLFGENDATEVVARLRAAGVRFGALKRGALGPLALDGSGQAPQVEPVTDVADTTAAGDSFNAGFLAAHAQGRNIMECMRAGHDLSAQVIRCPGAIMPRSA